MKFIIETKEEFEKLDETSQGEYEVKEGVYTLKLEGHEEHLIPKHKNDLEKRHRKEAEKKLSETEEREAKLLKDLEQSNITAKKVQEIRESHEAEIAKIKEETKKEKEALIAEQGKSLIKAEASEFANKHFTTPTLISKVYEDRLTVETIDGKQVLRVLEEDGSHSVKSVSDLRKEFLENEEFKSIVKAKSGSGGGAEKPGGPGGSADGKTMKRSEFEALNPNERAAAMAEGDLALVEG